MFFGHAQYGFMQRLFVRTCYTVGVYVTICVFIETVLQQQSSSETNNIEGWKQGNCASTNKNG